MESPLLAIFNILGTISPKTCEKGHALTRRNITLSVRHPLHRQWDIKNVWETVSLRWKNVMCFWAASVAGHVLCQNTFCATKCSQSTKRYKICCAFICYFFLKMSLALCQENYKYRGRAYSLKHRKLNVAYVIMWFMPFTRVDCCTFHVVDKRLNSLFTSWQHQFIS